MSVAYLKLYLTKLKNTSVYKKTLNNFFLFACFVFLFLCTIHHIWMGLVLISFGYYLYRQEKVLLYIACFLVMILFSHYYILEQIFNQERIEVGEITEVSGRVVEVENRELTNKITIQSGIKKMIIYDSSQIQFSLSDMVVATGRILPTDHARIPNGFNYKTYLKHEKSILTMKADEIRVEKKQYHINLVREYVITYVNYFFEGEANLLLKALVIGKEDFSDDLKKDLNINGILHLFAISGSHIGLFVVVLDLFCKKYHIKYGTLYICIFLFLFLVITNFQPSIVRAVICFYLWQCNTLFKLHLSRLDIISISFIGLLIYNPYYMYQLGFILSYIMTFTIILMASIYRKYPKWQQACFISLTAFVVTLPITININHEINLLSPITNLFFITLVEGFIMPISFIVFVFPPLGIFYKYLALFFIYLTKLFARWFVILIPCAHIPFSSIFLYYVLLLAIFFFFHRKTIRKIMILFFSIFLCILNNIVVFQFYTEVIFLDVYHGESILIKEKNNRCNALIDTGDSRNDDVVQYLKQKGIKKLDYLFLTHNHEDHNGKAKEIINQILVNKIILHAYDNSEFSKYQKVEKIYSDREYRCGGLQFYVIPPKKQEIDENNHSLMIYSYIGDKGFLFLGDATKTREEEMLQYSFQVDILKVAHHGSATSTSNQLLVHFKPEYAIIQTGRIKQFGFPHKEVIDRLKEHNIKIFRTDVNHTIIYQYHQKKSIIKTLQ